jgi:uncharacterized protein (DUF58 family)
MRDSKRYLRREAIERISRLDLKARAIVEGFLSGLHRSPYFGQSLEFRQHREYAVGDDPRHVDWKVWARQDRMYVKQYEEDTNLRCYLLVDISRSMDYGQGDASKFHYAGTLASCLAYLVLRQQDAAGCLTFDNQLRQVVPARTGRAHLQAIVSGLTQVSLRDKTDMQSVLRQAAEAFPRRGMIILMTDAFAPREGLLKGLRLLRQRGHDVSLFHILHEDELDFAFTGPIRFEDLESPSHLTCNPRSLREGYLQAMQEFLQQVRRGCAKLAVDYSLVKSSDPCDAALATFLARRQRARTGRM